MSDVRLELGFAGGSSTTVTADSAQWDQLQAAISGGDGGWFTLSVKDDSSLLVDASKVVFARSAVLSRSIGFGS
jgi:hypothetical protein